MELEAYIFRAFISLWYLPLVKFFKKSVRQGWHDPEILYDFTWNYPIKNMNLTYTNYHWKKISWLDIWYMVRKILEPQKRKFWEKEPKNWKIQHFYSSWLLSTMSLLIETSFKVKKWLSLLWKLEKLMINVKT